MVARIYVTRNSGGRRSPLNEGGGFGCELDQGEKAG